MKDGDEAGHGCEPRFFGQALSYAATRDVQADGRRNVMYVISVPLAGRRTFSLGRKAALRPKRRTSRRSFSVRGRKWQSGRKTVLQKPGFDSLLGLVSARRGLLCAGSAAPLDSHRIHAARPCRQGCRENIFDLSHPCQRYIRKSQSKACQHWPHCANTRTPWPRAQARRPLSTCTAK